MKFKSCLYLVVTFLLLGGCSTTPGDAAYKGGHFKPAADLYVRGANQGDADAALKLGLMIQDGNVSSSTYGEALSWYLRACQFGENAGCHNSGIAYEYGKSGASKDYEKAKENYLLAATKGYIQSQYNLGSMYSNQYFKNDIEGLKWLLIANRLAKNCSSMPICQWIMEDPPHHRQKLISRMTNSQITEAKKLAKNWSVSE